MKSKRMNRDDTSVDKSSELGGRNLKRSKLIMRKPSPGTFLRGTSFAQRKEQEDFVGQSFPSIIFPCPIIRPQVNGLSVPDEAARVCSRCRAININRVLDIETPNLGHSEFFGSFHHSSRAQYLNCPLCNLLRQCTSHLAQTNTKSHIYLSSAATVFNARVAHHAGLIDTPCLTFQKGRDRPKACLIPTSLSGKKAALLGRRVLVDSIDFSIIRGWLSYCDEHHQRYCGPDSSSICHGLTVIDCWRRTIVPLSSGSSMEPFVTLSYVWGASATEHDLSRGQLPSTVPRLIEDAISVTKNLQYRYLWVDRYCIPKNDQEERQRQIKNMGHIYAQSVVTIIASGCNSEQDGLPGVSSARRTRQSAIRLGQHIWTFCSASQLREEVTTSKWNTRGWTFQEGILSRRRLIFSKSQVYFQCQCMHLMESVRADIDALTKTYGASRYEEDKRGIFYIDIDLGLVFPRTKEQQHPISLFNRIHDYMQRDLTYEGDIIDAISGVLSTFEDIEKPVHHLLGIPLYSILSFREPHPQSDIQVLAVGLSWKYRSQMTRRRGFPSWTWAGWKPMNGRGANTEFPSFRIVSCQTMTRDFYEFSFLPTLAHNPLFHIGFDNGSEYTWCGNAAVNRSFIKNNTSTIRPTTLRICGWSFELVLGWASNEEESWFLISPAGLCPMTGLEDEGPFFSGINREEFSLGPQSGTSFTAVVMGFRQCKELFTLLVLTEVSPGFYERLDCFECKSNGALSIVNKEKASIGDIELQWQELIIG